MRLSLTLPSIYLLPPCLVPPAAVVHALPPVTVVLSQPVHTFTCNVSLLLLSALESCQPLSFIDFPIGSWLPHAAVPGFAGSEAVILKSSFWLYRLCGGAASCWG